MSDRNRPEPITDEDLNDISGGPVFDFGTIYYPEEKNPPESSPRATRRR